MSKKPAKKSNKAEVIDWVEPYPPPSQEQLVRASVTQVFRMGPGGGKRFEPGTIAIIRADEAHQHAASLAAPPPAIEE